MDEILFYAELREETGKGPARQARAAGFIPGVLYGAGHTPCQIKLEKKGVEKIIRHLTSHNIIASLMLKQNGNEEKIKILLKDIQIQPIKNEVIHLDFYRIRMDKPIRMQVPIHLKGEAPGLELGGIMEHDLREIEIQALPDKMPEFIEIDVSSMQIGDSILVDIIKLADDIEILESPEKPIISILAPKVSKDETEEEEEAAVSSEKVESAEPEVISKQKAEERRKEKESQDKK